MFNVAWSLLKMRSLSIIILLLYMVMLMMAMGELWNVKWNIIILEFMKSRFQLSWKSNSEAGHPTECWRRVLLQHQSGWWGQVGSLMWVACWAINKLHLPMESRREIGISTQKLRCQNTKIMKVQAGWWVQCLKAAYPLSLALMIALASQFYIYLINYEIYAKAHCEL